MSATYFEDEGVTVVISDIARQRYDSEQRDFRHDHQRAEILTWGLAISIAIIAAVVIKYLMGTS
jgi:hypothetical protein